MNGKEGIGDVNMKAISRFCRSERAACWRGEGEKKPNSRPFPFISGDSSRAAAGFGVHGG